MLEELKKHPQIIKQKTSAIRKTVCANIGIEDENLANSISFEIDTIKKILELHKNGHSAKKIFQDIYCANEEGFRFAFEFEINQIIKIFEISE